MRQRMDVVRCMRRLAGLVVLSLCQNVAAAPAVETEQISRWADTLSDRSHEFSLRPEEVADPAGLAEDWRRDRDWAGLGRDSAFLVGYQLVVAGVLWALPSDLTNWSEAEKSRGPENWANNVAQPAWDADSWWINYVAHPYFGAAYYIRARERGFDAGSSFVYSALMSAAYEFGVEAFFEKPSIQDLIVTPVGGALLGAFVFEPIRSRIRLKRELAWYDRLGLILTDPVGALNGVFEGLFGIRSDVRVNLKPPIPRSLEGSGRPRDRTIGFELSVPWH